jgi:ATP-dependent Clp protease protease subunit
MSELIPDPEPVPADEEEFQQLLAAIEADPPEDAIDLTTVYISFSAEINASTTESLITTLGNCANQSVETVHLLLSTPGGSVMNGINIYNLMRAMPFHIVTHNVGNVDSIGNAIFLAGDERYACPHSTFMFHGVSYDPTAGRLDEKSLREFLGDLEANQTRIGSILEERTNLEATEIKALFLEAQTKDATYAVRAGIVQEIKDVEIPPGGPIVSLVFER